jgi:hypothetical protein
VLCCGFTIKSTIPLAQHSKRFRRRRKNSDFDSRANMWQGRRRFVASLIDPHHQKF